jgi:hypothetical protein
MWISEENNEDGRTVMKINCVAAMQTGKAV